jgi:Predicted membrane protein
MDAANLYLLALKIGASAMVALWVASLGKRDASLVDLWWGPGFAVAALIVWAGSGAPGGAVQLAALGLTFAWSARLALTMVGRRRRHPGEDPRYTEIREAWGRGFWWKSLFIVFLLQAVLQWAIAFAPMAALAAPSAGLGPVGGLGCVLAAAGLAIEWRADAELDRHKRDIGAALCRTGLRRFARYPNYSGEILFWWGLWMIAAEASAAWTAFAPTLLTLLLWKVSGAPILDARLADRPGFAEWRETTPAFLPVAPFRLRRPSAG